MLLPLRSWTSFVLLGMVDITNIASRKELELNNFELEGVMRAVYKDRLLSDQCVYGKLK